MRIPPSPWWDKHYTKSEVHSFWQAFARKVDQALSSYKDNGELPSLVWNCQTIHAKHDHSFRPGPVHTLPFGIVGDQQRPLQEGIATYTRMKQHHRHDELRRRRGSSHR